MIRKEINEYLVNDRSLRNNIDKQDSNDAVIRKEINEYPVNDRSLRKGIKKGLANNGRLIKDTGKYPSNEGWTIRKRRGNLLNDMPTP